MIKHIIPVLFLLIAGCGKPPEPPIADVPQRIISTAPNITATLQDMHLDARLVGISSFSPEDKAGAIPIVGDFLNLNYERVVALRPDLVILERSADAQKSRLESLGIPYLETGSLTLIDVLASVRAIGNTCGTPEQADELIADFNEELKRAGNELTEHPRTLIVFGDFSGSDRIEQLYAMGADCIHSELLALAGGDNVVSDRRPSIMLSREGLLRINPEVIIELTTGGPGNNWQSMDSIDAVRNDRVYPSGWTLHLHSKPRQPDPDPAGFFAHHETGGRRTMTNPFIQIEELSLTLSGSPILNRVSLSANAGEYVSIIGPNGAGKTSLIKCMAGIHRNWTGRISLKGRPVHDYPPRELARLQSYVPQAEGRYFPLTSGGIHGTGTLPAPFAIHDPFDGGPSSD